MTDATGRQQLIHRVMDEVDKRRLATPGNWLANPAHRQTFVRDIVGFYCSQNLAVSEAEVHRILDEMVPRPADATRPIHRTNPSQVLSWVIHGVILGGCLMLLLERPRLGLIALTAFAVVKAVQAIARLFDRK